MLFYAFSLFVIDRANLLQSGRFFNSTIMRIFACFRCDLLPDEHKHANTFVSSTAKVV